MIDLYYLSTDLLPAILIASGSTIVIALLLSRNY